MTAQPFWNVLNQHPYKNHIHSIQNCKTRSISVAHLSFDEPKELKRSTSEYVVSMHLTCGMIEIDCGGAKRPKFLYQPGDFDVSPAGEVFEANRYDAGLGVVASFPQPLVAELLQDVSHTPFRDFGILHMKTNRSALVTAGCLRLVDELISPSGLGASYTDHLVQTIVVELAMLSNGLLQSSEKCIGSKNISIIDGYIQDHLAMDISVRELADLVGLSEITFSRHFRKITGQTPYQYILAKRISCAQRLVRNSNQPFAQIAFECGFSSQSHMTRIFKTKLGTTPKHLRE